MSGTATREIEASPAKGTVNPAEPSSVISNGKETTASPNTRRPNKKHVAGKKTAPKKSGAKPTDAATKDDKTSHTFRAGSKAEVILQKLKTVKGFTIDELVEATGWQSHSVRGFMSGTVKKKLGLEVVSEPGKDGVRRYRIADGKSGK